MGLRSGGCHRVLSAFVALALLKLIGLFTNLFFYQRWSTALVSPAGNHLGNWAVLVPVAGALIIGLMARYGSERIRGHGIPEAIEAILINGSRVEPRVAISEAAVVGHLHRIGRTLRRRRAHHHDRRRVRLHDRATVPPDQRGTQDAAGGGRGGGMSATFAAPVAAVLLAVELLLFEWKPRSLIPMALASVTAGAARRYLLGMGPLFPVPAHPLFIGPAGLAGLRAGGRAGGRAFGSADLGGLRGRGLFRHTAHPLDVVAGVGGWRSGSAA